MIARLMGLKTISPKDLLTTIQENNVHVYDLNSSTVYASGHIPGAIHLNHETFNGEELPADNHAEVVFYCSNPMCRKAPNAAKLAKSMGYTNAKVLSAGISGWMSKKLPVETS
ncbi:MAG: rhodanese-like domain-containing protein [Balneolaceae bacterium]|nr:rhodanese-like domain-containing protein [Balneolaceae bacterium]